MIVTEIPKTINHKGILFCNGHFSSVKKPTVVMPMKLCIIYRQLFFKILFSPIPIGVANPIINNIKPSAILNKNKIPLYFIYFSTVYLQ